jgi:hypothetical protein
MICFYVASDPHTRYYLLAVQKTRDHLSFATLGYIYLLFLESAVKSVEYQKVRNQSVAIGSMCTVGCLAAVTILYIYIASATCCCAAAQRKSA